MSEKQSTPTCHRFDDQIWLKLRRSELLPEVQVMLHPEDQDTYAAGQVTAEYVWVQLQAEVL